MGVPEALPVSVIPSWLRLSSPEPMVLTAGSLSMVEPVVDGGGGSTSGSPSILISGGFAMFLFLEGGGPMPVFWMVLESEVAAF